MNYLGVNVGAQVPPVSNLRANGKGMKNIFVRKLPILKHPDHQLLLQTTGTAKPAFEPDTHRPEPCSGCPGKGAAVPRVRSSRPAWPSFFAYVAASPAQAYKFVAPTLDGGVAQLPEHLHPYGRVCLHVLSPCK